MKSWPRRKHFTGTWVTQLTKLLTLGWGSGHELEVCGFKHLVRLCTGSVEPPWDSFSLSLPLCPSPTSLSQKEMNIKKRKPFIGVFPIFIYLSFIETSQNNH